MKDKILVRKVEGRWCTIRPLYGFHKHTHELAEYDSWAEAMGSATNVTYMGANSSTDLAYPMTDGISSIPVWTPFW